MLTFAGGPFSGSRFALDVARQAATGSSTVRSDHLFPRTGRLRHPTTVSLRRSGTRWSGAKKIFRNFDRNRDLDDLLSANAPSRVAFEPTSTTVT